MSKDGKNVYGVGGDPTKLARWRPGSATIEEINLRDTIYYINVLATNEDGSVVTGYAVTKDVDETYWVWTASGGFKYLSEYLAAAGISTIGWSLLTPQAISGDGKVMAGWGFNANGDTEAIRIVVP